MKTVHLGLSLACLTVSGLALADVTEEEVFEFEVNAGAKFSLENVNGDVSVDSWSEGYISVRAIKTADNEKKLQNIEIIVDADRDKVSIDTEFEKSGGLFNWSSGNSGSVEYQIRVPRNLSVSRIETINGEVELTDVIGAVVAETVNGDLTLHGLDSGAQLETVNGDIEAHFVRFGAGQEGAFETVNGGIRVYLPDDADASVYADTLNGSISNSFGLKVSKGFVSRELEGSLGSGAGRLKFETVNGSIVINSH